MAEATDREPEPDTGATPRALPDTALVAGDRRELPSVHTSLSAPPTRAMRKRRRRVGMVTREGAASKSSEGDGTTAQRD